MRDAGVQLADRQRVRTVAGAQRDAEQRTLREEEIRHRAAVAEVARALQQLEELPDQARILGDQSRFHADQAFKPQVAEAAPVRRQSRRANVRAPRHAVRPALRAHESVFLERLCVTHQRERMVRRNADGYIDALADHMQQEAIHVGAPLAWIELVAERRLRREGVHLLEEIHALHHPAVGLVDRIAQGGDHDRIVRSESRGRGEQDYSERATRKRARHRTPAS
jgi:hypothetical protein